MVQTSSEESLQEIDTSPGEIESRVEQIRRAAADRHLECFDSLVESDFVDNSWRR